MKTLHIELRVPEDKGIQLWDLRDALVDTCEPYGVQVVRLFVPRPPVAEVHKHDPMAETCLDCHQAIYWCENLSSYYHASSWASPCFLIREHHP